MTARSAKQHEPAVAVGSSQRPWVAELMSYAQDHAGVRVVGTVLSSREAVEQAYDVLLIDDTTSYLTKRLIDKVQLQRRVVIGVFESTRGDTGRTKLLEMGVDAVIDADSSPKEFMSRIRYVAEQRLVDRDFADIVADEPHPGIERVAPISPQEDRSPSGKFIIVVSGSNGVTEVSVGLASEMVRLGMKVVIIDLDTIEPTLAQRLAIELSPNVLTAIEALRHAGVIDGAVVAHGAGFNVLSGMPSPREWEACPPDDAADLVSELGTEHDCVIVRVDRQLEDLAPFGVRSGRFGVARRMVADADHLIVVGDPSPTGVTAVLSWIGEARGLSGAPIHVVLNHCGRSLYQRGEIAEEIARTFNAGSLVFAPEEHRVRKASWQGEVPDPGRFSRSLQPIAARVKEAVSEAPGVSR